MNDSASSRRDRVLGGIRGRLGGDGLATERKRAVAERLAGQAPHLIPERDNRDAAGLEALFAGHLRASFAVVVKAAGLEQVPATISAFLRGQNLPLTVRCGNDPWLRGLDWSREPALTLRDGPADPADEVGLAHAVAGVAETGTLMLASGPDNPVTNNFLPETSIVLLRARDLVGPYESAFDRIRATYGRGVMPRTVNFISGPSRTADVGGRLVTGAHGPRRLCVVIVEG